MNPADLPLRDIHLPQAVGWWPLAPGWWLLIFLLILALVAAIALYQRRSARLRRRILRELTALQTDWQAAQDHARFLSGLSALMRRSAIALTGRETSAGLSGARWQQFLNDGLDDQPFSAHPGALLVDGVYRREAAVLSAQDVQAMLSAVRRRIAAMKTTSTGAMRRESVGAAS